MLDISKWDQGDDPITKEQVEWLNGIMAGELTEEALEGFLVVSSRLVDEFGNHRTAELEKIFRTQTPAGRGALRASLEHICRWIGGMKGYASRYPVTVIPPRPAFPLFKIIGIHHLADRIYRVLDSRAAVGPSRESIKDNVMRTGRLPAVPRQRHPVRRSKPLFHWCSYEAWASPDATRAALQILPEWSDCRLRATLPTSHLKHSVYVAFNADRHDPENSGLRFYKYFYEPLAQDHSALPGEGPQLGVEGGPVISSLEEWDDRLQRWEPVWAGRLK
jgi:hypothetical protein